jgi:hypothetical protein
VAPARSLVPGAVAVGSIPGWRAVDEEFGVYNLTAASGWVKINNRWYDAGSASALPLISH